MKYFLNRVHFSLKIALLVLTVSAHHALKAQSFYQYQRSGQLNLYGSAGLTKYFGELHDEKKLGDINPYLALGIRITLPSKWWVRPELTYYRLSAADADLPEGDSRRSRNLSFRSDNFELSGLLVYGLYPKDQRLKTTKIRPYLMAGLGVTYFNPKARYQGKWYELQPLHTEGIDYQKFHLVVPLGFSLGYQVSSQWEIGLEMKYRFTFTDYLDDVSTRYRDPASFPDPIAAALADRRPEIGLDKAPTGSPRGNSEANDGYLLFGLSVQHQLPGRGPVRRRR